MVLSATSVVSLTAPSTEGKRPAGLGASVALSRVAAALEDDDDVGASALGALTGSRGAAEAVGVVEGIGSGSADCEVSVTGVTTDSAVPAASPGDIAEARPTPKTNAMNKVPKADIEHRTERFIHARRCLGSPTRTSGAFLDLLGLSKLPKFGLIWYSKIGRDQNPPIASPYSSGIVSRVSGVRVTPPAAAPR